MCTVWSFPCLFFLDGTGKLDGQLLPTNVLGDVKEASLYGRTRYTVKTEYQVFPQLRLYEENDGLRLLERILLLVLDLSPFPFRRESKLYLQVWKLFRY